MAEMNQKRGANNDRGSLLGRLPTGRAMPPELLLLLTAFVWGGYHPCMRMLLTDTTEHGSTPTPSEINLARFSLVAVLFVAQAACADAACFGRLGRRRGGDDRASLNSRGDAFGSTQSLLSAEEGAKGVPRKKLNRVLSLDAWMSAPPATGPKSSASSRNASLWGAACELAFWHFVTIAFQSTGVKYTGATRAGFIAASTTMMVPFVSTLAGEAVKSTTWIAACVAVCGTALIVFASSARSQGDVMTTREEEEASYDVFFGDVLTLIGSVAWAFFTFRLSRLAPNVNPLKLAVARSFCMACFVGVWFLVERLMSWSAVDDGGAVDDDGLGRLHKTHVSWLASPRALALTAFMAVGPGWLCGWWQTVAQASVPAARAAVLLATTPLWGAAWAAATMGERMATVGWVGGLTVVGGTMLVALER